MVYLRLHLAYEGDLDAVWKTVTNVDHLVYMCGHQVTLKVENCLKRTANLAYARVLFEHLGAAVRSGLVPWATEKSSP